MLFIVTPNDNQEGFGDIASNIWMAMLLRQLHPTERVVVFVTPNYRQRLKKLAGPGSTYDPDASCDVTQPLFFGIEVANCNRLPDTAQRTCNVSFSNQFSREGTRARYFREYDELTTHFYVVPTRRLPAALVTSAKRAFNVSGGDVVCVAYASKPNTVLAYIKAVCAAYPDAQLHFICAISKEHTAAVRRIASRESVKVSAMQTVPFQQMEALVTLHDAHVPMLTTGDMSLTLALQHGKSFVYEMLSHKDGVADLLEKLYHSRAFIVTTRRYRHMPEAVEWAKAHTAQMTRTARHIRATMSLPRQVIDDCRVR